MRRTVPYALLSRCHMGDSTSHVALEVRPAHLAASGAGRTESVLLYAEGAHPRVSVHKENSMAKNAFWTRRRFTGITLILGCFLFLGALGLMPRDTTGNFMV